MKEQFKRVIKYGLINFIRNSSVSFAAIVMAVITLFTICSAMFLQGILDYSVKSIESKADINLYFTVSATSEQVGAIKQALSARPEVKEVVLISKEDALEQFRARYESDSLISQSLNELNDNPFGDTLNIKAKSPDQYESISNFLKGDGSVLKDSQEIIYRTNYNQNKEIIDKLMGVTSGANRLFAMVIGILIIISIIVTYNTVRLVAYMSREEISVMRLVGASNFYIRGPFIIEGMIYGLVASIITMIIFYPISLWLGKNLTLFFGGLNLFSFYLDNFPKLFFVLLSSGVGIGAVSSFFAVRRYLKR